MNADPRHVGRFAPSPTGPLHFGSLVAALGSHVAARAAGGRWLLRIDDIDPPRAQPGAVDTILRQLEAFGLEWDGGAVFQGARGHRYAATLGDLEAAGAVYPCTCTRREINRAGGHGPLGAVYPGTCRAGMAAPARDAAARFRLAEDWLALDDAVQGHCALEASREIGDIVLKRRDGLWAYHLANAVDDAELGITDAIRGADLLPAALVQVALARALGYAPPRWAHLPVARTADGDKLSKQTGAAALGVDDPVPALLAAWRFLGQEPPPGRPGSPAEFHDFARARWTPHRVPAGPAPAPTLV